MSVAAKLLRQKTFNIPGKLEVSELFFGGIPRDWSQPGAGEIQLFARSVRRSEKPADPADEEPKKHLPWLLYLQGGPGFGCASPQNWSATNTLLDRGYQLLFLDQRGTGLSNPLSASVLKMQGDDAVQADYLKSFRADSIVKDCEAIRTCLTNDYPAHKRRWSIMGQSFGGFCCVTYLSKYPQALKEAFILGGLPPLVNNPYPVYQSLIRKIIERNEAFYRKYPEDAQRVKEIVDVLQKDGGSSTQLPSGAPLSARKFQQLGLHLGFHGGIDLIHELLLHASNDLDLFGHLTRPTLSQMEQLLTFDDNIIYAILHEPIYCQGKDSAPTWSADRILKEHSQFKLGSGSPIFFTGETIHPWMFEDYAELRKLKGPAELIAQEPDWPELYDKQQLARNQVPVYAAVYQEDMYVDYALSMETARAIQGCKTLVTNLMYHDALRSKVGEVLRGLFTLRDDVID